MISFVRQSLVVDVPVIRPIDLPLFAEEHLQRLERHLEGNICREKQKQPGRIYKNIASV